MNPKSPKYKFKKAWSWPYEIEKKIKELCEGTVLHVCSGESELGDVRIDLSKKATVKASMFYLPVRPGSFDTVLCDPPWELPYHLRGKVLRQLRDAIKPGGRLIFNCFWFPRTRGLFIEEKICPTCGVDRMLIVGAPHNLWRNASLLVIARRMALPLVSVPLWVEEQIPLITARTT
jgi:hypothetical protein